ncbi:hypothetical protein SBC2_85820 (plasmid) [Caballeronia sp. SBC2]|nr:hypothetical protein SBC2_85820 [Caballeronia sp. SBC2]
MIGNIKLLSRLVPAALPGSVIKLSGKERIGRPVCGRHARMCQFNVDHAGLCALGFADVLGAKNVVLDPSRIAPK